MIFINIFFFLNISPKFTKYYWIFNVLVTISHWATVTGEHSEKIDILLISNFYISISYSYSSLRTVLIYFCLNICENEMEVKSFFIYLYESRKSFKYPVLNVFKLICLIVFFLSGYSLNYWLFKFSLQC